MTTETSTPSSPALVTRWQRALARLAERPLVVALRELCADPRVARAATYLAVFACTIAALAPVFAARDLPLIDLPVHIGSIQIWNDHDDAARAYAQYYQLHIVPAPYWVFYGFVHYLGYLMPLRWAAKLFVMLSILAMPLGLAALLRAHRGPVILGLAGFIMAWGPLTEWGLLANVGAVGPLLFSYALLATLARSERPGWKLYAGNAAMGVFLQFSHPIAFLLWLGGALVYTRGKHLVVLLPAAALFGFQFALARGSAPNPQQVIVVEGMWKTPLANLQLLYGYQLVGSYARAWRLEFVLACVACIGGALWLGRGEALAPGERRDRRPLYLFLVVVAAYFLFPYHLQKPLGFAGFNTRVPPVLVLAAFGVVAHRRLGGWRTALVCAPVVVLAIAIPLSVFPRFAEHGRGQSDFYGLVERLPAAPRVLTLVYEPGSSPWSKYPCYVVAEKGGYQPCLWESNQGIGAMEFPVGYRPGTRLPAPPMANAPKFSWEQHAGAYDYFLTRREPRDVFARRAELELVEQRGDWKLWKRKGAAP